MVRLNLHPHSEAFSSFSTFSSSSSDLPFISNTLNTFPIFIGISLHLLHFTSLPFFYFASLILSPILSRSIPFYPVLPSPLLHHLSLPSPSSYNPLLHYSTAVFEASCAILERLLRPQDSNFLDQQTEHHETLDLNRNQITSTSGQQKSPVSLPIFTLPAFTLPSSLSFLQLIHLSFVILLLFLDSLCRFNFRCEHHTT